MYVPYLPNLTPFFKTILNILKCFFCCSFCCTFFSFTMLFDQQSRLIQEWFFDQYDTGIDGAYTSSLDIQRYFQIGGLYERMSRNEQRVYVPVVVEACLREVPELSQAYRDHYRPPNSRRGVAHVFVGVRLKRNESIPSEDPKDLPKGKPKHDDHEGQPEGYQQTTK